MKIVKISPFSTDFSTVYNKFSASNPVQMHFSKFLPKFSGKIQYNFKTFWKIAKFSRKNFKNGNILPNNCKFFFFFFKNFLKTSPAAEGPSPGPPSRWPSYKPSLGGPRFPIEKFLRVLMLRAFTGLFWKCIVSFSSAGSLCLNFLISTLSVSCNPHSGASVISISMS